MTTSYKNFWALNVDEAVVAGILRGAAGKNPEVFMPLNAQMKGIDLVLVNTERRKIALIQVKGSRAYEPRHSETKRFGEGSGGWFYFPARVIQNSVADYFIFLIYVLEQTPATGRRGIVPHTITIPTRTLRKLVERHKKLHGGKYSFYFRINPAKEEAVDDRDKVYMVSEYLDEKGILKVIKSLK
jgi:hypothetical protein